MDKLIINKIEKMTKLSNINITYNQKLEEMDNDTLLLVFNMIKKMFDVYKDSTIKEIFTKYNINLEESTKSIGEIIKISNQINEIMSNEDLTQLQSLMEL